MIKTNSEAVVPVVGMKVDTMDGAGSVIEVYSDENKAYVETQARGIIAKFDQFISVDGKVIVNRE